jgi:poly(3-hydroxybutyrate) depolymerase
MRFGECDGDRAEDRAGRAAPRARARSAPAARVAVAFLAALALAAGRARAESLGRGVGRLEIEDPWGEPIRVHVYQPARLRPTAPVLIVLHGVRRNAEEYLDAWIPHADRYGVLLVVPHFSGSRYRDSRVYQAGNVLDGRGRPRERREWVFGEIERIFDRVREAAGNRSQRYFLYGHSAGAQFVHRMVMLMPEARFAAALAANAGSYTMSDFEVPYPFGLRGAPVDSKKLRAAFGRPLVLLLGEDDDDPRAPHLPDAAAARRQGPHRLARGRAFFARAEAVARELDARFAWRLETVPGVGHDQRRMARAASALLFGEPVPRGAPHRTSTPTSPRSATPSPSRPSTQLASRAAQGRGWNRTTSLSVRMQRSSMASSPPGPK